MLFVCERARKAAATNASLSERSEQCTERAINLDPPLGGVSRTSSTTRSTVHSAIRAERSEAIKHCQNDARDDDLVDSVLGRLRARRQQRGHLSADEDGCRTYGR